MTEKEKEMIEWIDKASYFELLEKWRFESIGSKWFQGEVGDHFSRVMKERKSMHSQDELVYFSKMVGLGK